MRKLEEEIGKDSVTSGRGTPRSAYKKPVLIVYGKIAEVTAGVGGSNADPGHTSQTKKGGG